jgi:hypothetical protein
MPYRTPPTDIQRALDQEPDPHKRWLLENHDWRYEEMEWADAHRKPLYVIWRVDGVRVGVYANITGLEFQGQVVVAMPSSGIRQIVATGRGNVGNGNGWTWRGTQVGSAWHPGAWVATFGQAHADWREPAELMVRALIAAHATLTGSAPPGVYQPHARL